LRFWDIKKHWAGCSESVLEYPKLPIWFQGTSLTSAIRHFRQLGLTGDDSVGLTKDEVEELVASADADGNGVLDYEEFKVRLQHRKP
jgi:hypothetical protein